MNLQEVFKTFEEKSSDLEDKFKHLPLFHSNFQLEAFVLFKDCVDEYGVYKKARNELEHRFNSLEDFQLEYDKLLLEKDIIENDKSNTDNDLEKRGFDLDLRAVDIKLKRLERSVSELSREFDILLKNFSNLYEIFKDKKIEELELEHWLKKYINLCVARINKGDKNWKEQVEGFTPQFQEIVFRNIKAAQDKQLESSSEGKQLAEGSTNA